MQNGHPELRGYQKKFLKGLAHGLKPTVFIGQKGLGPSVVQAIDEALIDHELIKVRFLDSKDKDLKKELTAAIEAATAAQLAGAIGHVAIFYRCHKDPARRKIALPER